MSPVSTVFNTVVTVSIVLKSAVIKLSSQQEVLRLGIVVSMMACSPEDPGSIPRLAKPIMM